MATHIYIYIPATKNHNMYWLSTVVFFEITNQSLTKQLLKRNNTMDIPIYPIFAPSVLHSIPFSVLQMPIFFVGYHFCLVISTLLDGHSASLIILLSWFYHLCLLAKSNALATMSPLVVMFSVAYIAVSRWPNHIVTCILSKYNFLDMKLPNVTLWSLCCSCLHPHHISSSRDRENSLKQVIKTHVPSFWGYQFWLAISHSSSLSIWL